MSEFKSIATKSKATQAVAHVQRKVDDKSALNQASTDAMPFLKSIQNGGIQAKLSIGEPNDQFEVEADSMADHVMRMPAVDASHENVVQKSALANSISTIPIIQTQTTDEMLQDEQETGNLQLKELSFNVNNGGDDTTIQRQIGESAASTMRPDSHQERKMLPSIRLNRDGTNRINRQEEDEDILQKKENQHAGRGPPQGDFSSKLNQSKGSGQPLDSNTNSFMSSRFGADFSGVRIHDNSTAAGMSSSINAKAFTHQNNIYFNQGQYQPNTSSGKHLLAHELTHTIQQGAVKPSVQAKLQINEPNDAFEKEADSMANTVMRATLDNLVAGSLPDLQASQFTQPNLGRENSAFVQRKTWDREEQYNPYSSEKSEQIQRKIAGNSRIQLTTANNSSSIQLQRKEDRGPPKISADQTGKIRRGFWDDPLGSIGGAISSAVDYVGDSLSAGIDWIKDKLAEMARSMPGYSLFTVAIGRDPIADRSVERNGRNFINAGLDIIPNGADYKRKLEADGGMETAVAWLDEQLGLLDFSISDIAADFSRYISGLSLSDVASPTAALTRGINVFRPYVDRIITFARNVANKLLEIVKEIAIRALLEWIKTQTPWYPLLTVVLGEDPISGEVVERNGMNILRGFILLHPEGTQQLAQMEESGSLQRAAAWVDEAIVRVSRIVSGLKNGVITMWNTFTITNLLQPIDTFNQIYNLFSQPVSELISFAVEVALMILKFIKDALIARLIEYAKTIPGYNLVTVILGKDVFSQEPVERSMVNIIHGFMGLIPGGEEKFQELNQTGAIQEAVTWIEGAIAELNLTWDMIRGIFTTAWDSFSLTDLATPIQTFGRVLDLFGAPIGRILRFVGRVVIKLIEIALRIMGFPFELIGSIISNAQQAYESIKNDPIGFLKNLLKAVKQGFIQFFGNIVTHLVNGVGEWLFGQLGEAGITIPPDFSFQSILNLVFQILGITRQKIFDKIRDKVGPERWAQIEGTINTLTGVWSFVSDVVTRGPIAIWEKIQEKLTGLWDTVISAARGWIMTKIIEQVTVKLLSFLDPTGIMAVVNSFIAFFRAVQSAIEYMVPMLEMLNSFLGGIVQIAQGNIQPAADLLERTMARGMPILIGFLANQVGLGRIGAKIKEVIESIQAKVDEGLQWVIDKAWEIGGNLLQMGRNAAGAVTSAVTNLFNYFTRPTPLALDSGHHSIYFKDGRLMMASNELPILQQLDLELGNAKTIDEIAAMYGRLQVKITDANREYDAQRIRADGGTLSAADTAKNEALKIKFDEIKTGCEALLNKTREKAEAMVPPTVIRPGSLRDGFSTGATANPLSIARPVANGLRIVGSSPSGILNSPPYSIIGIRKTQPTGGVSYWKAGHLVAEAFYGSGNIPGNIVPMDNSANLTFSAGIEQTIKNQIWLHGRGNNEVVFGGTGARVLSLTVRASGNAARDGKTTAQLKTEYRGLNGLGPTDTDDVINTLDTEDKIPSRVTAEIELLQQQTNGAAAWVPSGKKYAAPPITQKLPSNLPGTPKTAAQILDLLKDKLAAKYSQDNNNQLTFGRLYPSINAHKTAHWDVNNPLLRDYWENTLGGKKSPPATTPVSPKLKVGSSSAPEEIQADRMADRVMRKSDGHAQIQAATSSLISRMAKGSEGGQAVSSQFDGELSTTKGNGRPMDSGTQSFMENRFGANFGGVKIHTGAKAASLSNQIQAKAFTTGNDIYFNEGQYNPSSESGKHLLAHELTHTIQQGAVQTSEIQRKGIAEYYPEDIKKGFLGHLEIDMVDYVNFSESKNMWEAGMEGWINFLPTENESVPDSDKIGLVQIVRVTNLETGEISPISKKFKTIDPNVETKASGTAAAPIVEGFYVDKNFTNILAGVEPHSKYYIDQGEVSGINPGTDERESQITGKFVIRSEKFGSKKGKEVNNTILTDDPKWFYSSKYEFETYAQSDTFNYGGVKWGFTIGATNILGNSPINLSQLPKSNSLKDYISINHHTTEQLFAETPTASDAIDRFKKYGKTAVNPVSPKLKVGSSTTPEEIQADQMADQVMRKLNSKNLSAHELTHTIQQGGSVKNNSPPIQRVEGDPVKPLPESTPAPQVADSTQIPATESSVTEEKEVMSPETGTTAVVPSALSVNEIPTIADAVPVEKELGAVVELTDQSIMTPVASTTANPESQSTVGNTPSTESGQINDSVSISVPKTGGNKTSGGKKGGIEAPRKKPDNKEDKKAQLGAVAGSGGGGAALPVEREMAKPKEVNLPTTNTKAYRDGLVAQSPTSFITALQQSNSAVQMAQNNEKGDLKKSLPEIEQPTGLPTKAAHTQEKIAAEATQKSTSIDAIQNEVPNLEPTGKKEGEKIVVDSPQPPSSVWERMKQLFGFGSRGSDDERKSQIKNGIKQLPTSESIETDPGTRPGVDLTGQANPLQNEENQVESENTVDLEKAKNLADSQIYKGENDIYPEVELEMLTPQIEMTTGNATASLDQEMPPITADLQTRFDAQAQNKLSTDLAPELQKQDADYTKMQADQEFERAETDRKIEEETQTVKDKQVTAQQEAQTEVSTQRANWQKENESIKSNYSTKSTEAKKQVDTDIEAKSKEADKKVEDEYANAKEESDKEVAKANKEAEEKKAKAKRESENKSWWDRAVDAISDFFDMLKDALNALFDGLKKLVKGIIELAKKVVNAIIDLARDLIVGLIKGFGALLKGLVNIALAAFPELRDRINKEIDKAVDTAVEAVNQFADDLKKAVNTLLDALGAALDFILSTFQNLFNFFIDALKFIATALIRILEFIANIEEHYDSFKKGIDGLIEIWNNPKILENMVQEFLSPYISSIPTEANVQFEKYFSDAGAAFSKHAGGVWRHLQPILDHMAANWWEEIKKMAWFLIWPFAEGSPLWTDATKLWNLIPEMWTSVWDGDFSRTVDLGLEWMQAFNMTLGAFAGWILIGSVLVGAIIGAFFGGVGAIPGAAAGLEVGVAIGEGLLISMVATEAAIILKAIYDLMTTEDDGVEGEAAKAKKEGDGSGSGGGEGESDLPTHYSATDVETGHDRIEYAYQRIANSGFLLAVTAVFMILGAIGGKIAQALKPRVKVIVALVEDTQVYKAIQSSKIGTSISEGLDKMVEKGHTDYRPGRLRGKSEEVNPAALEAAGEGKVINTAAEVGDRALSPMSSLSKRQRGILERLENPGDFAIFKKKDVSMADLLKITNATGDEFSMFTLKGERLIIRGKGREVIVTEQMAQDLIAGKYGKFSGHTHPPGSSVTPGPGDRPFLEQMGQERSGIWGNTADEPHVFGRFPEDDVRISSQIGSEKMKKYYEGLEGKKVISTAPEMVPISDIGLSQRHFLDNLTIPKKAGNTIFTISKEEAMKDLLEIRARGDAIRVNGDYHTSSGRIYRRHDNSVHPVTGSPGTIELTNMEYNLLVKAKKNGAEAALRELEVLSEKGILSPDKVVRTRELIDQITPSGGKKVILTADPDEFLGTFNPEAFEAEIIALNRLTDGGGELLNGNPSSAIYTALYYPTPAEQGAAIFRSISHGHMFQNGNKRTAVAAFQSFAKQHGLVTVSETKMLDIATKVAMGEIKDVSEIAKMLVK